MKPESVVEAQRVDAEAVSAIAARAGDALPLPPLEREPAPAPQQRSPWSDIITLLGDIWHSRYGAAIVTLFIAIAAVIIANMVGQVWLNAWNGAFFDAIEKKNTADVGNQLLVFLAIVAVLLALVVTQTFLHEIAKLRLREWLTHRLLDDWLVPGRAYRLGISAEAGVNPDQRMQEDAKNLSEMSADLGIGFVHHVFLLLTFVGVLWGLSRDVQFMIAGIQIAIPGYMVWCAFAYAAIGSTLTWLVGRRLVALNAERYAREAELRFALVRVSERAEAIALYRGEEDERSIIDRTVDGVLKAVRRLAFAIARLTWITSGYGWLAIVVPVLVALPGYLQGSLTLGGLMMVVGAFNQVQQALRWFVDNYARIADWRAAMHRVMVFHDALSELDEVEAEDAQIELTDHPNGYLAFENVSVLLSDGRVVIAEATAEITPGERVLIVGESGTGKSTLFRAISGLWPWGSGRILLPPRGTMMFMPQHPYLPLGTLRAAAAYPAAADAFTTEQITQALERVALGELVPMIEREERWDRLLSLGQQQRLAFARLLLHKPRWVFLDEATGALDIDNQKRVMSVFEDELKDSTLVSIGHRPSLETFHKRTLQLIPTPDGARLRRRARPKPVSHAQAPQRGQWLRDLFRRSAPRD